MTFSPPESGEISRFPEVGQQIRFKEEFTLGKWGPHKRKVAIKRCIPRLDAQLLLGDRFEVIDMSGPQKMVCVFSLYN